MSAASMVRGRRLPMKPRCVDSHGMPEGERGASRLVRFRVHAPAMPEFDARQRAVFVDRIGHQRMGANVLVVPE